MPSRPLFIPKTEIFIVSVPPHFEASLSRLEAHEQPPLNSEHIFLLRETQGCLLILLPAFRIVTKA